MLKVKYLVLVIILALIASVLRGAINIKLFCRGIDSTVACSDGFREINMSDEERKKLCYKVLDNGEVARIAGINEAVLEEIVFNNIYGDDAPYIFRYIIDKEVLQSCISVYQSIFADIRYFPVADDIIKGVETTFDNSWGSGRSYGGDRTHQGTDIMSGNNIRGYFPVLSITDGVIENVGWLELGGYRVGVRSPSGAYYYYAHLCEYAEGIEEGAQITAGTVLGTMGDTGYSQVEGTTGNFDVHLHMGVYYGDDEVSYNPYNMLKILEEHKVGFASDGS